MADPMPTTVQEWRRNWTVVLAAFLGFSFLSVMTASEHVHRPDQRGVRLEPDAGVVGLHHRHHRDGADVSGGYGPFLIVGTVGSVACGLLLLTLPAYPDFRAKEDPATPGEAARA